MECELALPRQRYADAGVRWCSVVPVATRAVRRRVHHASGRGGDRVTRVPGERGGAQCGAKGLRGAHGDATDGRQRGADAGVFCRDDCGATASASERWGKSDKGGRSDKECRERSGV